MPYTFLCCNPRISKIELNLAGIAHKPDKIQHFHTCRPHTPIGLQRQLRGGPPATRSSSHHHKEFRLSHHHQPTKASIKLNASLRGKNSMI